MKLGLSWSDIFPLWIYTRQGKWWTTDYTSIAGDKQWVYAVAISRTRNPAKHSQIIYPVWQIGHTRDVIVSTYDTWEEARDALDDILDELSYIAAGWRIENGDSLSCMSYVRGESTTLREGIGLPPAPPTPIP